MPRSLTFRWNQEQFVATLNKVDRSQLYGSVHVETRDQLGERCSVATLASDGKTLVPKGGSALGYVNPEGLWLDRDDLLAVDVTGKPLDTVASSFDAPIDLGDRASNEEFLDHSVRLVYRLLPEPDFPESFVNSLAQGDIHRIGFSYRGGIRHDPAFVLADADNTVWLLITHENQVENVGLEQAALCAASLVRDEQDDEPDDGTLDFGML